MIGSAYKLKRQIKKLSVSQYLRRATVSSDSQAHLSTFQVTADNLEGPRSDNLRRLIDLLVANDKGPSEDSFKRVVEIAKKDDSAISRLDCWLELQGLGGQSPGAVALKGMRFLKACLAILGALSGAGIIAALLKLESGAQVNILWFLALALLQAIISMTTFVFLARGTGSLPILGEIIDHLPSIVGKTKLAFLLHQGPLNDDRLVTLRKPFLFFCIQYFNFAFSVSALLTLLSYIAMQDIGFGWSTTLSVPPSTLHAFTAAIATPWAWAWSGAAPTLETIQATQYFSANQMLTSASPLGSHWWSFLWMSWLVYAVLPRLVLWLLARHKWRTCSESALFKHPLYSSTIQKLFFNYRLAIDRAIHVLSEMIARMAEHVETASSSENETIDPVELKIRWQNSLLEFERGAIDQLLEIFFTSPISAGDSSLPDPESLFSVEAWTQDGLSRKESALIGAAAGAGLGMLIDSGSGFLTFGAGSISGAIAGAALSGRPKPIEPKFTGKGEAKIGPAGENGGLCFALVGRSMNILKAFLARGKHEHDSPLLDGKWQDFTSFGERHKLAGIFREIAQNGRVEGQKEIEKFISNLANKMIR